MKKYTTEKLKEMLEQLKDRDLAISVERANAQNRNEWRAANAKLRQNFEEMEAVREEIGRRKDAA